MNRVSHAVARMTVVAALLAPAAASAQRAGDNAVASAEDAFGTKVGLEDSGIYTEAETRGFSPTKAGNVRIDGIYVDPITILPGRIRATTAIRVGFAAAEYPFHAPTGIVDHRLRSFPTEFGVSLGLNRLAFGGWLIENDWRIPVIADRLGFTGGIASADTRQSDGAGNFSHGVTFRPIARLGGLEVAPFVTRAEFHAIYSHPLAVVRSDAGLLPRLPNKHLRLGQRWAKGSGDNNSVGGTFTASITGKLLLRGGFLHAEADRGSYFTEVFAITGPTAETSDDRRATDARYLLIADQALKNRSKSGEVQAAWLLGDANWQHRIIAGYRSRARLTETGGSFRRDFGLIRFGEIDQRERTPFSFGPINTGRIHQTAIMVGYFGRLRGVGSINLGLQKARFRGISRDGRTDLVTTSRDDPWLYNVVVQVDATPSLSFYAGTETGLEDSGIAPENAVNRNEQMPATRTEQFEGGVRWRFTGGQFVLNAFQITKPYFSLDDAEIFAELGQVRHRGVEASLSGRFGERLNLIAGALAMQPRVSGPAVDAGVVGRRPTGTPSLLARIDANYRTDLLGGVTAIAALSYSGRRAVTSRPAAGKQLAIPSFASIDLGFRRQFHMADVPASIRAIVQNVFDTARWKVAAANTLHPDERRRFTLSLTADF